MTTGLQVFKRALDIVLAGIGFVFTSPLFVVAAVAIKLSSSGPVFYRAQRAGKGGVPFVMLKFRTMRVGADAASRITAGEDDRIFPTGRVLRRFKLDELPQLLNVLRGEMSIVGPRPEDLSIVEEHYTSWMRETLAVAPGITSPGSLHGTMLGDELGSADPEADYLRDVLPLKLALELQYVRNASLTTDLRLIVRTVLLIGRRTTAEHEAELVDARRLLSTLG